MILKSLFIFLLAGILEIAGGYLVWLWLKEEKSVWLGVIGCILLGLYGVVATWQSASFGRVYAVYGGIFIVLSILWAYSIDGFRPDFWDMLGGFIIFVGVCIMMYTPRSA